MRERDREAMNEAGTLARVASATWLEFFPERAQPALWFTVG